MSKYIVLRRDLLEENLTNDAQKVRLEAIIAQGSRDDEGFLVFSSLDPEFPHIQGALAMLHASPEVVQVDETWLVLLPGQDRVQLLSVTEKTRSTVQLTDGLQYFRYRTVDIEWVERYGEL